MFSEWEVFVEDAICDGVAEGPILDAACGVGALPSDFCGWSRWEFFQKRIGDVGDAFVGGGLVDFEE